MNNTPNMSSDNSFSPSSRNFASRNLQNQKTDDYKASQKMAPVKPREEVVYRYEDKKPAGGCKPNLGCGCKAIGCFGCIGIILVVVLTLYVFIAKPQAIWTQVVTFLNADISVPEYKPQSSTDVQNLINNQITKVGDLDLVVTQDQLTTLTRDKLTNFKNLVIQSKPGVLKFYWDLDSTVADNPLKGVLEMTIDQKDGKIVISKIGTQRIGVPDFLNQIVTNAFYSLLNIGNQSGGNNSSTTNNSYGFISNIIPSNAVTIKSITFEEGLIRIKATINVNLFSQ